MSGENFYLSELDTGVDSISAALRESGTSPLSGDVTAKVDVSVSVLQNLFQFQTDSADITNANNNDIKYKVEYTTSTEPLGIDLDTKTEVTVNAYASTGDVHVTYEWVRHLAHELFNTHFGADLFSNELELRTALNSSFKTNFNTKLLSLATLDGNQIILDAGTSTNNPSLKLLDQISQNAPSRLNDITPYRIGETDWYKMPILVNDKLYFVLTISAAADQEVLTSVSAIGDRTYLIEINVVADPVA